MDSLAGLSGRHSLPSSPELCWWIWLVRRDNAGVRSPSTPKSDRSTARTRLERARTPFKQGSHGRARTGSAELPTTAYDADLMRYRLVLVCAAALSALACGPSTHRPAMNSRSEDSDSPSTNHEASNASAAEPRSETSDWHQVQSFESSSSDSGISKRKSHVIVTSDPAKHGDSLHFRFLVNASPISGVFVAPGGQTTTFTIPVGTVHFTVDECEWEAQGFELVADEDIPIACKLTKEGDCCEVAIPVENEKPAKSVGH